MKKVYKLMLALLMVAAAMTSNKTKAQTNYSGFEYSTRCLTAFLWATDKRAFDSCAQVKFSVNGTYVTGVQATYTFPKAGTYTVCIKIYNACKKWDTSVCKSITVKSCCDWSGMGFSYSNKCKEFTFEGKSSTSGCLKYQFYISGSNGAVITLTPGRIAKHTFLYNGSYTVKMYVVDTCNKCDTAIYQTVKVDCNSCNLNPDFSYKYDCLKAKFLASGGISGASYSWSFGDGSSGTGNDPTHTYVKSGTYKVCLTMAWKDPNTGDYCKKQVCKEVKISCGNDCNIKGDFKFTTSGGYAKFEAYSNTGYYYEWSFGDGTYGTGKSAYHQYKKPGTYTVCVKIYDKTKKCSVKICKTVVIEEPCNIRAAFVFLVGSGGEVKFAAVAYNAYKFVWSFGDGTSGYGDYTTHKYAKPGTYKVCLTVYSKSGKCSYTVCKTVVIGGTTSKCNWAAKGAGFSYSLVNCPKLVLEGKNLDNGSPCIKYIWAITPANSTHTTYINGRVQTIWFTANGSYNICLKMVDSCNKCDTVICKTININCISTKCNFTWATVASYVSCMDAAFGVNAPSSNAGCYKYTWSTGGTSSSSTGRYWKYAFTQNGTYKVCLKIEDTCNKCDTTICMEVKINCTKCDWSKAGFDYKVDCRKITAEAYALTGCYVYSFTLSNNSGSGISSSGRLFAHQVSYDGTYTLCLKIKDTCNNCDTVICKYVKVDCNTSKCDWTGAGFAYSNKCRDFTFEAKKMLTSSGTVNTCIVNYWSVGGTSAGSGRILNYSFSKTGTYVVCVKYYDTCKKCDTTICQNVKVDCNPCSATAKFTVDSTSKYGVVYLTNHSTGAKYYSWDFGDSTYSYLQNPGKHAYSTGGTRKICLTVYDSLKTCSTTYCVTVQVVKSRSNSASVSNISASANVKVYPNPASDYLTIDAGSAEIRYTITNLQGQEVISGTLKNSTTVSTQGWAEGIYLVKTVSNGIQNTTRVVVVRQ